MRIPNPSDIYEDNEDDSLTPEDVYEHGKKSHADTLLMFYKSPNICEFLETEEINSVGGEVVKGYEADKASRGEWDRNTKDAIDLALQVTTKKSWPWAGAANIKYPLVTMGAIQFAARAYPAIVQSNGIVKGEVIGFDPDHSKQDRADRIGMHMTWQLIEDMDGWEEDTDKLLLMLAIVGCVFRKVYFDPVKMKNVSQLIRAEDFYVNHGCKSLKAALRKTHKYKMYSNDIVERQRLGIYREVELGLQMDHGYDLDDMHDILEQHCWYDLDEDGYKEPYIVTVHEQTGKVLRIVAGFDLEDVEQRNGKIICIRQKEYFVKYPFIPNPDGGFYDIGLGTLQRPINETINTALNQMMDAATLQTAGGGFIGNGMRIKAGAMRFQPGEYKFVDSPGEKLQANIVQLPAPGPSPISFQLVEMLIQAGNDIASVKDILTGEQAQPNMPATTTLALIEQAQKQFTAIHKRIYRSLKEEFKLLFNLNKQFLNPSEEFKIIGPLPMTMQSQVGMPAQGMQMPPGGQMMPRRNFVTLDDYRTAGISIVPVADPNIVSDAQEMMRAQMYMQLFHGDPFINQAALRERVLRATKEQSIPALLVPNPPPPPPSPQMIDAQAKVMQIQQRDQKDQQEFMVAQQKIDLQQREVVAKIDNWNAQTANLIAQIQQIGGNISSITEQLAAMSTRLQIHDELIAGARTPDGSTQGTIPGMAQPSGNPPISPVPGGLPGISQGSMGNGPMPGPGGQGGMQPPGGPNGLPV